MNLKNYVTILSFLFFILKPLICLSVPPTETEKLVITCKVWGFLKYYHPKVANGDFNWDQQLFDILPKIEQAKTKEDLSLVIENWINSLGEIKKTAPIIRSKDSLYFDKNFDLSWINRNENFTKILSKQLRFIEKNRHQGKQFYVVPLQVENVYTNNEDFGDFKYEDKNSRILALFRYWNFMEYFFPYKYLMNTKWDKTLNDVIPLFINAQNENDYQVAMATIISRINDSHAGFYLKRQEDKNKERRRLPFDCKIIDEKIIITKFTCDSLANKEQLKIGDVITKVNGKTVKEIIEENRDLISASNEAFYLDSLADKVISTYFDAINLTFLKDDQTRTINCPDVYYSHCHKNKINKPKKEPFRMLDNNIGYVNMGIIKVKNIPEMIEKLNSAKAIIFDMRNYPNATFEEISNFINPKVNPFAIYTKPDLTYPGMFWRTKPHTIGKENPNNYKGKVIVLLNEKSMSQSEWTAMCFQTAGNTTIIGSQTAGADGNVTPLLFTKDYVARFSGIGVYYPDGRETQRIGIVPDIEIKPTIKGIQEGRDEVLERALQFIETGK